MQRWNRHTLPPLARATALALAAALMLAGCAETPSEPTPASALKQPKLAIELPEKYNTPDGMAVDPKTGDIFLSCPNFNDDKYPAKMLRIDKNDRISEIIDLPVHPETKKAGPLGVAIGPDGNLYIADNQAFGTEEYKSRLVRVVMKDGKAEGCEVLVTGGHKNNWSECIRTRKRPICDVEIGCRSVTVCHLGNIAYWLNRPLKWDPVKEDFIGDPEASRWLSRPKRAPWRLG